MKLRQYILKHFLINYLFLQFKNNFYSKVDNRMNVLLNYIKPKINN
jgi:hypothetical protein